MRHIILLAIIYVFPWLDMKAMFEGTFLYFPSHERVQSSLKEWRVGGSVIGFCREVKAPKSVWLITHGNAGQAAHRQYIVDCLPSDAGAYVLEYPGYGLRPGKPSMQTINKAAEEAFRELQRSHPNTPIGVVGESLGSGPAAYLCSLVNPPARAVFIVAFDNLVSVGKEKMKWLPVGLLMRDQWDNIKALKLYRGKVTVYGAQYDTIIPVAHARQLAKSVPGAQYVEMPSGHNDWASGGQVKIQ